MKIKFYSQKLAYNSLLKQIKKKDKNFKELENKYAILRKKFTNLSDNIKLIKNYEYRNLYDIYRYYGISDELMNRFLYLEKSCFYWKNFDKRTWLVYISCLLEKNNRDKALEILNKYIYYHGLSKIEHFLSVADFADINGYSDDKIKQSAIVYRELLKSKEENFLYNYLENKTIAIVGNAPNIIGTNKGEEIDSHDIVIRFNNYMTVGYEQDCGAKTDIWCNGLMSDIEKRNEKYSVVLHGDNAVRRYVPCPEFMYEALENKSKICCLSNEYTDELRKLVNYNPTQGFILIYNLSKILKDFKNIDFYGFNFLQDNFDDICLHYFNDRNVESEKSRKTTHNFYEEAEFLLKLIEENK